MSDKAQKAISYMAENSSVIAKLTQKAIMTGSPDWALKRIKDITYDTSKGHNPRWVRVWTTPPTRSQYTPMLPSGANRSVTATNPQTGADTTVTADKTGRGCSLAADTMQYGYDVKTRQLKGRAIEIGPWCVLDLIEKEAWQEVIARVWRDVPKYGKEQFSRQLLRDVIQYSKLKFSVAEGFPTSTDSPYFPCVPTGGPSIGFIRQIEDQVRPWGWDEGSETPMMDGKALFQVRMGYNAIEWAIEQRKKEKGMTVYTEKTVDDKTFGMTTVYEGIQFMADKLPTRGYVREVAADTFEFVEIDPYLIVAADGEGFKPIPNPEYYQSFTTIDGARYRVLEVGYFIHPEAMTRESLATVPSVPGKQFKTRFDFSVNPIPDWELAAKGCNKDQFYFGYRMLHAYAPRPVNPELMGAFLYIAPIPQYQIIDPWSNGGTPASQPTTPAALTLPPASSCEPCDDLTGSVDRETEAPSDGSDYPENGVGVIQFAQDLYEVSETVSGVTIRVFRLGGNSGAASVVLTITEGTATEPENWTKPTGSTGTSGVSTSFTKTLSWADGEDGAKTLVVPIVEAAGDDTGKHFAASLGTFSGASAGTITAATVTILDDDEA